MKYKCIKNDGDIGKPYYSFKIGQIYDCVTSENRFIVYNEHSYPTYNFSGKEIGEYFICISEERNKKIDNIINDEIEIEE